MFVFRVKVWVVYIVFLSNGIFRSQSRGGGAVQKVGGGGGAEVGGRDEWGAG